MPLEISEKALDQLSGKTLRVALKDGREFIGVFCVFIPDCDEDMPDTLQFRCPDGTSGFVDIEAAEVDSVCETDEEPHWAR